MKSTALTDKHIALGAKMVPFAGFNMPVYYEGIKIEHNTVRDHLGIFDVSHMGEFTVTGNDALNFLQYVTSNDVSALHTGKIQYTCFPNDQGGIVDDLLVYCHDKNSYFLVVNASNIEKDWDWINKLAKNYDVELENISDQIAQVAVQGPKALKALQGLTDVPLDDIPYYTFTSVHFSGIPDVLISATGYTGSGGFELYCQNEYMPEIWDKVLEAGAPFGIKPIGLGARDTLRLEVGFCLYGNDIDDTTSPIEAGLGWITKFNKDFMMKDYHLKLKEEGVTKKLVGIELIDKGIPRQHMIILNRDEEIIGEITSGTQSPYTGRNIALGYVLKAFSKADTELIVQSRNKLLQAKVVKLPFYKKIT
ncbi:MAG: glycine cleavage system aminomethyltransferase GcvT [Bacteroidetes bacterium]|nr:glycine cleavage system aminomethyltransferase GcvT [Bacteroidota bacterium]MBL6962676.1 glycine cleavage system aminomethyltransferase GcvT [Bacteroidota bacterium]